ncbi:MAG: ribonuclease P protein component [Candidatus Dependentiae bacterium]
MMRISQNLSSFTQHEIAHFFKSSRRVYKGPSFDILCLPATKPFGRIIVITPRKIGNAPARNKIRRQIKAIFYQEQLYLNNVDCMVIIKKLPVALTLPDVTLLIKNALENFKNSSTSHANTHSSSN